MYIYIITMGDYTTKALYDVIKLNLLIKDKDLMRFIRTNNDEILLEYGKIKNKPNIDLNYIVDNYESYTIVYMTIRGLMSNANINEYQERSRDITNMFLNDTLEQKPNNKSKSIYDSDE